MKNIIILKKILKIALFSITLTSFGGIATASGEVYVGKFNNTEWYITDLRKEKKEILTFWIGEAGNSQPAAIDCATSKYALQDGFEPIVITKEPNVITALYQQLCDGTKVSQKGLTKFTGINQPKPEAILSSPNQTTRQTVSRDSGFEKFAFEGCVAEGKYNRTVCACNAKELNLVLSDQEKANYRAAAAGNMAAALALLNVTDKLMEAFLTCSSR